MSISWPHFLHGDPKLLNAVEGLKPDPSKHSFYIDFQPVYNFIITVLKRILKLIKILNLEIVDSDDG